MSLLFYRRPDLIKRPAGPLDAQSCQRIVNRQLPNKKFIPDSVSFDRIIEERTLPPCSLSDFMDYLVYVTYDAENLQFFMWYRDYLKRFNELSPEAQSLSPPVDIIVGQNSDSKSVIEMKTDPMSSNSTAKTKSSDFPIPQTRKCSRSAIEKYTNVN